jgi:hypothetical protein
MVVTGRVTLLAASPLNDDIVDTLLTLSLVVAVVVKQDLVERDMRPVLTSRSS